MSENAREHIVVTGASQGMGAAIARRAAEAFPGARLSLLARSADRLKTVSNACIERGAASAKAYPGDLTVADDVSTVCERLLSDAGPPTLFVNNAGTFMPGGITDTTLEKWRQQMDINLTSAFLVSSHLVPAMIEAGRGHALFVVSVAAIRGYPRGIAYCASKHGLLGLVRAIREETKKQGIRVTAVLPGATLTSSWEGADIPDERLMPPEDIAEAVVAAHRLSDRSVVEEILIRPQLGDV